MSYVDIERPDLLRARQTLSAQPPVLLCRGTSHGEWANVGSSFRVQVLEPAGVVVLGTVYGPERLWNPKPHWKAIGDEIAHYMNMLTCSALGHSHALQPLAIGIAQASAVALVSVSGPVRKDMLPVYAAAARNTQHIVHTSDPDGDWTAVLGQVFGRMAPARLWAPRARPFPAGPNVEELPAKGAGHSRMLYEEPFFDMARVLLLPSLLGAVHESPDNRAFTGASRVMSTR